MYMFTNTRLRRGKRMTAKNRRPAAYTEATYMAKGVKINRRRKKGNFLPVLLAMLVVLIVSFVIAWIWQNYTTEGKELASRHSNFSSSSRASGDGQRENPLLKIPQPVDSAPDEQEPPITQTQIAYGVPVPESDPVVDAYFDNAVFVGDSITDGVSLYGVMKNASVLAGTGINLDTIYTSAVIKDMQTGARSSIMDSLALAQYERVYVLLGGNEVRYIEKEAFIRRYGKVLDDIRKLQPDAVIYVQSITPVAVGNYYDMDNGRITEYNEALKTLCGEKQIYYLDVAETLEAEDGTLQAEFAAVDGMHFEPVGYKQWFNYLRTHTVDARPDEKQAQQQTADSEIQPSDGESEQVQPETNGTVKKRKSTGLLT